MRRGPKGCLVCHCTAYWLPLSSCDQCIQVSKTARVSNEFVVWMPKARPSMLFGKSIVWIEAKRHVRQPRLSSKSDSFSGSWPEPNSHMATYRLTASLCLLNRAPDITSIENCKERFREDTAQTFFCSRIESHEACHAVQKLWLHWAQFNQILRIPLHTIILCKVSTLLSRFTVRTYHVRQVYSDGGRLTPSLDK